jgi:organic radical activating enzyme
MMTTDSKYYCSHKFRFIKIDLESRTTYTCHAARPHRIDFEWLENNPGQLFNTPINVYEREQMLRNQRNDSCEQNCWPAEDRGAPSPRLISQGQFRTHTDLITHPEIIDITLNSDCNLTCSYCCKEFSTSWRNDILQYGNYNIESESDRYSQTRMDQVLSRVSQAERFDSSRTKKILDEIRTSSQSAKKIIISGGEPFLSKYLVDIVKENHHVPEIRIFTGLGVDTKRFERITDILAKCKNVILVVSADSTGTSYEFNRYGMAWSDFLYRVEILTRRQLKFEFSSVISNLTVSGFAEFYKQFGDRHIRIECVYNPNFLSPHILDTATKNQALADIESIDYEHKQIIIDSMQSDPTAQQRADVARFLHEFVARRPGLTLSALPKTFTDWIEHVV